MTIEYRDIPIVGTRHEKLIAEAKDRYNDPDVSFLWFLRQGSVDITDENGYTDFLSFFTDQVGSYRVFSELQDASLGIGRNFYHSLPVQCYFASVGGFDANFPAPKYREIENGKFEVSSSSTAYEAMDLVLENPNLSSDLSAQYQEKIESSQTALLAGCMSVPAAAGVVKALSGRGFSGRLSVADRSIIPLAMTKAASRFFEWKERFGVDVWAAKTDLSDGELNRRYKKYNEYIYHPAFGVALVDLIDPYMADEEIFGLGSTMSEQVENSGIVFVRAMEQFSSDGVRLINFDRRLKDEKERRVTDMLKQAGYVFSEKETSTAIGNMFPSSSQLLRGGLVEGIYIKAMKGFDLRFSERVQIEGVDPDYRQYRLMLFEKNEGSDD